MEKNEEESNEVCKWIAKERLEGRKVRKEASESNSYQGSKVYLKEKKPTIKSSKEEGKIGRTGTGGGKGKWSYIC